jgi:SAM-dependent methyltransferase
MKEKERWNKRYAGRELTWSSSPNSLFESLLVEETPGRALDVACGEGRHALWLASKDWQVDAVDFSEVGLAKARALGARQNLDVNWIIADVCVHNYSPRHYDLVAAIFLHTSVGERRQWLPNAINSVAPGGLFAYIAHDPSNVEMGVGGPKDVSLIPSVEEITKELKDFDIVRREVRIRNVAIEHGHRGDSGGQARDSLVYARRRARVSVERQMT